MDASTLPDKNIATTRGRAIGEYVHLRLPPEGLFAGHRWRIAAEPFPLSPGFVHELEFLGRILLKFYQAANLLYRKSASGMLPEWIARLLDQGKPRTLLDLQADRRFHHEVPRVIRPDLLLTDEGYIISELDSVPGGIGLTAWLNQTYAAALAQTQAPGGGGSVEARPPDADLGGARVLGGVSGMVEGFRGIFPGTGPVSIVISDEAATYRPEMEWLAAQLSSDRFKVCDTRFTAFADQTSVYRFFELFDLANVENSGVLFRLARDQRIFLTPPPKPLLEEKLLFALLWNRNLRLIWREHLGEGFLQRLLAHVPYTWVMDPGPIPPHAAIPELGLTHWQQLKTLSQRQRQLILKVSGFHEKAWGARGVFLGSDLSAEAWGQAVDHALRAFPESPFILQRYHKPKTVPGRWYEPDRGEIQVMKARARLCPYYFVHGAGDQARAQLGGVLATLCPAEKKIIHGMPEAILGPCMQV